MKTKHEKFPIVVKRGSCVVKIYRDEKAEGDYYRVTYYLGGKRQRLNFCDLDKAKAEAEAKAAQLSRGDVDAVQISGRDRLVYGRALEAVREHCVPLDAAALEYSEARKLLSGVSIADAARFYVRHHSGIKCKPVADAVDEMIGEKKKSGELSELYLSDLRYRLGAFRNAFHGDLNALTADNVKDFFDGLRLSLRSRKNFLRTLSTFFAFAKNKKWLSKEADLLEQVADIAKKKERAAPVEIFSPPELAKLLKNASSELVPCLALAAFAGLRSEEILRLEWADVERRRGFVEVTADNAKTATHRLVPILDNLAGWLAVGPRAASRVWPHSKPWFFEAMRNAASSAKITWRQNALRHSFISYRLAEIQNVNQVALEAGNSSQVIFRRYRELATPEQARSWFAIKPDAARNVVPMRSRTA